jgi:hypothetical protein
MKHQHLWPSAVGAIALSLGIGLLPLEPARAISFTPPSDNIAPRETTGGASRSSFGFVPPSDDIAPRETTGGASRSGGGFVPPSDDIAPRETTGGASRSGDDFKPPSDIAPRETMSGASRGEDTVGGDSRDNSYGSYLNTGAQPVSMLALTPPNFYGKTLQEHPTILVYLPASNAREVVFSLKDEAKNLKYQTTLPISGIPEVVAIQLPEEASALEIGKNYQWYVALKIDGQLAPSTPFVDSWIQRIAPDAELAQIAGKTALEQASALATSGIWYDCAATLASLKAAEGHNPELAQHWQELLASVQLAHVSSAPISAVN